MSRCGTSSGASVEFGWKSLLGPVLLGISAVSGVYSGEQAHKPPSGSVILSDLTRHSGTLRGEDQNYTPEFIPRPQDSADAISIGEARIHVRFPS